MTMLTTFAAVFIALAPMPVPATPQALPSCVFEDGNTDGQPCVWTDPDTGRQFFVDSANYR